ncbi:hypothetical protein GEMRC1_007478 [Eukaryota sp. GEM-RC1]
MPLPSFRPNYGLLEDPGVIHRLLVKKSRIANSAIVASRVCSIVFSAFLLFVFISRIVHRHDHSTHTILDNSVILIAGLVSTGVLFKHVGVGCLMFFCLSMYGLANLLIFLLLASEESEFWFFSSKFLLVVAPLATSGFGFIAFRMRRHMEYLQQTYYQMEPPIESASEFE